MKKTRELWEIFGTLPLKMMTNPRIKLIIIMITLVPSSNSCLNNSSLAGGYFALMFCAFPKALKDGILPQLITSNDNSLEFVCKQPETFRTPVQHFGRQVNQSRN